MILSLVNVKAIERSGLTPAISIDHRFRRRAIGQNMIYTDDLQLSEYCFDERRKSLFVTLTSHAYLDYTLNLIESVRRLGLSDYLLVFVLDIDGYNALLSKASETGVHVIYYPNRYNLTGMQLFQQDRWHLVSFCKIEIVYRLLCLGHDVLFTDSDIVFLKDPREFLQNNILRSDILIQDDSANLESSRSPAMTYLCMGFFYLKSSDKTVDVFKPRHWIFARLAASLWRMLQPHSKITITDQKHFNKYIKHRLDIGILPRDLFPNGFYYYNKDKIASDCYLIHFNYLVGDEKRKRMIEDGYYYLGTQ